MSAWHDISGIVLGYALLFHVSAWAMGLHFRFEDQVLRGCVAPILVQFGFWGLIGTQIITPRAAHLGFSLENIAVTWFVAPILIIVAGWFAATVLSGHRTLRPPDPPIKEEAPRAAPLLLCKAFPSTMTLTYEGLLPDTWCDKGRN